MFYSVILNRGGGTLRTLDIEALARKIGDRLEAAGHRQIVHIVEGSAIAAALDDALRSGEVDAVMIGGGDGSVSSAAATLMDSGKALAILPAGTMNLFARSLGIPLDLDEAIDALATAPVVEVDMASANGRPFVHQYSIGMHATLVHLREKRRFASRLGKISASTRAAIETMLNPPRLKVRLELADGAVIEARTSSVGITNNLYGEGHLPYTDTPAGGRLGIYITKLRGARDLAAFALRMARGRWRANPQVDISDTSEAKMTLLSLRGKPRCVIDGELCDAEQVTAFRIHPRSLKVLMPGAAA